MINKEVLFKFEKNNAKLIVFSPHLNILIREVLLKIENVITATVAGNIENVRSILTQDYNLVIKKFSTSHYRIKNLGQQTKPTRFSN
jgi:hypothetical protein